MRLLFPVFALLVLVAGALFGALNPAPVLIDLYLARFELSSGIALLLACLLGALLGGLAMALGVVLPLQRRLRRMERNLPPPAAVTAPSNDATEPV